MSYDHGYYWSNKFYALLLVLSSKTFRVSGAKYSGVDAEIDDDPFSLQNAEPKSINFILLMFLPS